jgi:hypothetical protein
MELNVPLPVIGVVHTSHAELAATPIQAGLNAPNKEPSTSPADTRRAWTAWRSSTTPG